MKTNRDVTIRSYAMLGSILAILVAYIQWSFVVSTDEYASATYLGGLVSVGILFCCAIYNFSSIVGPDEIGVILYFGRPIMQVSSGYLFRFPFYTLETTKGTQVELSFPGSDAPNIRITHGAPKQATADPLDSRLTTSVSFVATYKVTNFISYLKTIGNEIELRKQFRDKLINSAAIECAKLPVSFNLERREEINRALLSEMQKFTADWGITIINVQLQDIDLGKEIDGAQRNLSVSEINTIVNKNNSQKIFYDGLSEAKVHEAFLFAKTEGLKKLAQELGIDDKLLVLQLNTVENVFRKSNGDVNMYGSNFQQLANMVISTFKSSTSDTKSIT